MDKRILQFKSSIVQHLESLTRLQTFNGDGMNFGLPYMGSKNKIAQKIVDFLPKAEHFYDLFGGGGAISHCAYLSNKYKSVHYNEYEPLVYKGFQMAINGEFKDEKRWISREDFNALKDSDPYVAICFSFGTNLQAYAYGKDIEPIKKAFHYAICFDDYSMLDEYLGDRKIRLQQNDIYQRRLELQQKLKQIKKFKHVNTLMDSADGFESDFNDMSENLGRLERINEIKIQNSMNISTSNLSYDQVQIDHNSTIYCDPPYKDTASYKSEFDHDKFYEWCLQQKNVYISEYQMPEEDFKCIWQTKKTKELGANCTGYAIEKIFTPRSNNLFRELKTFEDEDW